MKKICIYFIVVIVVFSIFLNCSSEKIKPDMTQQERFQLAKKLFDQKKYLRAKLALETMTNLNIVSSVIDSAQYLLATTYYHQEQYITAIGEYQRLVREYPNSPLVDDSQYKIGECYYKISPNFRLDQEYTRKAAAEFVRFVENFPNSSLIPQALEKLKELTDKMAKKDYEAAKQYKRLKDFKAAIIYYDFVIQNYQDSEYVVDSYYQKGECLYNLKQYTEAKEIFETFLRYFSGHPLAGEARSFLKKINNSDLISDAK